MVRSARLFGSDKQEIVDLAGWRMHAPPERGDVQWKDGYSAKELAKAWLRTGSPTVPDEFWSAVSPLLGEVDEVYGRPEHKTKFDRYGRARQHDMLACARHDGVMIGVIGVEAKACETFDGSVRDRAKASKTSKQPARCNLLARALFGREVIDVDTRVILDEDLADHGYQLWTATVGTIIEAQQRGVGQAIVVVHQFQPRDLDAAREAGDQRDWPAALAANAKAFSLFEAAIAATGSCSHKTDFVEAGTAVRLVKANSHISS
jgi:hypothetical protein